ncbi:hypothetical protein CRG98_018348 [Punica granatum]|uniref:Uncharacterized protein n=1 Tax=Punica granatum TaxID=22663 RepID=A0A2I0JY39_PUNGR|nr:hypothetical protein CRG98_018348 [Punica granatum]
MGNGQSCKIVGIGDVCLETELGCKLLLKKVRHVPEIRLNLISTGQLDDEGYSNEFSNGRWKLSKGLLIVARGQKTDTLYRLRARHNSGQINVVEDYPIELWHRRLGHISEKGIQILARKQSLPVKGMYLSTCDHCLAGKQRRVSFVRSRLSRCDHILDLVHTDVCFMSDRSLGGALYFVTFIDDHSRKV